MKKSFSFDIWQVCENNHWFGYNGQNLFEKCPICGRKNIISLMRLAYRTEEWEKHFDEKLKNGVDKHLNRSKLIDSLPRMPWFAAAIEDGINDPDQIRSGETWSLNDAMKLSDLFGERGISTHKVWYEISKEIGRSLYAVERQLRIIIAGKKCNFDLLFPK